MINNVEKKGKASFVCSRPYRDQTHMPQERNEKNSKSQRHAFKDNSMLLSSQEQSTLPPQTCYLLPNKCLKKLFKTSFFSKGVLTQINKGPKKPLPTLLSQTLERLQ